MKKCSLILVLTALLTAVTLCVTAASNTDLLTVFDAGKALLFDTDNVTVKATADFSFEGERFKTVNAEYAQDGYHSKWQYMLRTPKDDGSDSLSGFTVIANDELLYRMDLLKPGVYYYGTDLPQNTLVRTSAQMDQLVALARAIAGKADVLLPENAFTVTTENDAGATVRFVLKEGDASHLVDAAFNLCAQMAIKRLIKPYDYDILPYTEYYGLTVADYITSYTDRFELVSADVTVTLDGNGRLRGVKGTMAVDAVSVDEDNHRLDVTFNVTASAYDTTDIPEFNPDDYNVVSWLEAQD